MDAITDLFDPVRDALGGGNLTLWLLIGGVVAVWLAVKAVKTVVKLALGAVALALVLGTVPWASDAVEGPVADCVEAQVSEAAGGWQTNLTKRVTVDELSPDAQCGPDDIGLSSGTAVARLRTFYDVPFQTWDVSPEGAEARLDFPD